MLLSGHSGPSQYQPIAVDVARLGYYAVLLDGKDILAADQRGGERLKAAILRAQRSDHAVPGKVAVIGFSQGGGGALTYATRLPDLAAIVVTYYPETDFITRYTDYRTFVSRFQVPVLILAGGEDRYTIVASSRPCGCSRPQRGRKARPLSSSSILMPIMGSICALATGPMTRPMGGGGPRHCCASI